jgi:hypothetical protein
MSKQFKRFRKNDYYDDENENYVVRSNYIERRNEKRVDRALKTKDISALTEEEDYIDDYEEWPEEDDRR